MRSLRACACLVLASCGAPGPAGFLAGGAVVASHEAALRPDNPASEDLFRFAPGDVVESFDSAPGHFRLRFARAGRNAVPGADADSSGAPDFVEQSAAIYEQVLARYLDLGFLAPISDEGIADNGGDGRFDVYFVDFGDSSDGAFRRDAAIDGHPHRQVGYMVQENDFAGYGYPSLAAANRTLASHEFFHAVQAAYNGDQGSVVSEGTAVWATETFDPSLGDFEGMIAGYLDNPDHSLDLPLPGPVDPFSYGSALFFEFLSERFGPQIIVELWTALRDGPDDPDPEWFDRIDAVLRAHASTFPDAFLDFATRNLFTGAAAEPARGYARARGYPAVKTTETQAPYSETKMRLFYASTQYYRLPVSGRARVEAALVPSADGDDSVDGLGLVLAMKKGPWYGDVLAFADAGSEPRGLDAKDADTAVVAVVNTNRSGVSKRPGLCIGAPDEVEACRKALAPPAPPPPVQLPAAPPAPTGCGCGDGPAAAAILSVASIVGVRRRRRFR